MALGAVKVQRRFEDPVQLLGDRLRGIYRFLAEFGGRLFPDDYFADLYSDSRRGRRTVPARVLATVMILQAHEGLSDQEAVDRLERDLAWQAAAGVHSGYEAFHSTVLVGVRNRLRSSKRPRRLFEDTRAVAAEAGVLKGRARVLDSTPLYDAVATQDTVTQLRSAIRKLLMLLRGYFCARWPSERAVRRAKDRIRSHTDRRWLLLPVETIVKRLNLYLVGWRGYFAYGNSTTVFHDLDEFVTERMSRFVAKKHGYHGRNFGLMILRDHDNLGLKRLVGSVRRGPAHAVR